jgi:hypothetical protein
MSPFNLADYEPVEERLARFWNDWPQGRVHTELVGNGHAGESVVMLAEIYKDKADLHPDATGHAQETPGSNPVNKTSWIENCETSAIGRALANMGYAPKGHRPSREEMAKAAAPRQDPPPARRREPTKRWRPNPAQQKVLDTAKDAKVDDDLRHRLGVMLTGKASVKDMTVADCDGMVVALAYLDVNREEGLRKLEAWEAKQ